MKQINITLTADEALMLVTALGTYQNRLGQHAKWCGLKRLPVLRQKASESEIEAEIRNSRQQVEREERYIERCIADGVKANDLKERVKLAAGITTERRNGQWKEES